MSDIVNDLLNKFQHLERKLGPKHPDISDYPFNEMELQSMWFEHLLPRKLMATDGTTLYIEQTGFWNHGPGPDFLNAKITWEDNSSNRGDVELHLNAKDWFEHSHHNNPAYSNVILNVSLCGDEPIMHTSKGSIKSVELIHQIDNRTFSLIRNCTSSTISRNLPCARPGECSYLLDKMSQEQITKVLREAGLLRLHRKAIYLRYQRNRDGDPQTFWENLAVCFGFSENKTPFKLLSRLVPFSMVESRTPRERDALLFGVAGFLPKIEITSLEQEVKRYYNHLWTLWWNDPYSSEIEDHSVREWKFSGIRPYNHPHRRLAALSCAASVLKKCLKLLDEKDIEAGMKEIIGCSHEFFDQYCSVYSPKRTNTKLIGSSRLRQILWNCFIPWILSSDVNWQPDWRKLLPESENIRIRRAIDRLFPGRKINNLKIDGLARQGLIEILDAFCSFFSSDCTGCTFPATLTQSASSPE